jgi:hypothetical protein
MKIFHAKSLARLEKLTKKHPKTTSKRKLPSELRLGLSLYQQLERPLKYTK